MTDGYQRAINDARDELKLVEETIETLDRRRAQLRQAIAVLQSLTGNSSVEDRSLTEAILEIVQAAVGTRTTSEVLRTLDSMGYVANAPTVATTLSRLVKTGQLKKDGDGYRWAGILTIDLDQLGETSISPPAPNSLAAMAADGRITKPPGTGGIPPPPQIRPRPVTKRD
ncbi:MAG: hypothetical protein ABSB30_04855 [Terracidiphilus sp.]|jgi:hypothetical protein